MWQVVLEACDLAELAAPFVAAFVAASIVTAAILKNKKIDRLHREEFEHSHRRIEVMWKIAKSRTSGQLTDKVTITQDEYMSVAKFPNRPPLTHVALPLFKFERHRPEDRKMLRLRKASRDDLRRLDFLKACPICGAENLVLADAIQHVQDAHVGPFAECVCGLTADPGGWTEPQVTPAHKWSDFTNYLDAVFVDHLLSFEDPAAHLLEAELIKLAG